MLLNFPERQSPPQGRDILYCGYADEVTDKIPICVDLDGTLVSSDSLVDGCMALARDGFQFLQLPKWLLKGKAHLKSQVARSVSTDVTVLPYHQGLLHDLRELNSQGHPLWLCTGADRTIAEKVANHLGMFRGVLASDGERNLVGEEKRKELEREFGARGFSYIGNSHEDLHIWKASYRAHPLAPSSSLLRAIHNTGTPIGKIYPMEADRSRGANLLRSLRLHQWAKNVLVFLPVMLSHKTELILEAVLGFFAFGFIASSGYLVNDVLDLNEDRKHQTKRKRPFASGELPVWVGLLTIPILWTLAALICAVLPPGLAAILVLYLLGTVSYSIWLKRFVLVDVMMLASLYTVRIVAGGAATNIVISPWTLTVSVFLFLSLALVKRVSELRRHHEAGSSIPGRDYGMLDAQHLGSMGIAAGYLSVLVTALYITSEDVALLYKRPQALWLILPVQLYWVSRVWLLANRGEVDDDPIIFAAKDKATYFASMLILTIVAFAVKSW